ncbi:MAG: hypothetical protein ACOX0A_05610 [Thermoguttaceae bacterium]|jgi:tetratricopeptide (TPR) repeat protein
MFETIDLTLFGWNLNFCALLVGLVFFAFGTTLQNGDADDDEEDEEVKAGGDSSEEKLVSDAEAILFDIQRRLAARNKIQKGSGSDQGEPLRWAPSATPKNVKEDDKSDDERREPFESEQNEDVKTIRFLFGKRESSSAQRYDPRAEEEDVYDFFESNDDVLHDDSLSILEKIARFRARLKKGDESCRLDLIRLLLDYSATSDVRDVKELFAKLDEAQELLDESETVPIYDRENIGCYIALYRAFLYMRMNVAPPLNLITDALRRARDWNQREDSDESRLILARAWLLHGQFLLASGGSATALASFQTARKYFEASSDFIETDRRSFHLGSILASEAEAYGMTGDVDKAIAAYRKAALIFNTLSSENAHIEQQVVVLSQLGFMLLSVKRYKEAFETTQKAISLGERLYAADPVSNFAPMGSLLRMQADVCYRLGDFDGMFAFLDRAKSILVKGLKDKLPLPYRCASLALLSFVLRDRAAMSFERRRLSSMRRDLLDSLRCIAAATQYHKIDSKFMVLRVFTILYLFVTTRADWSGAKRLQTALAKFYRSLTPFERWELAPAYSEFVLDMSGINAQKQRLDESDALLREAVEAIESNLKADDFRQAARRRLVHARAIYHRGCRSFLVEHDLKKALKDFDQINSIFHETDVYSVRNLPSDKEFYLNFLIRYACLQSRVKNWRAARDAIVTACRFFMMEIESGDWFLIPMAPDLAFVTLYLAREAGEQVLSVRLAAFWLKYLQHLRSDFLKKGWRDNLSAGQEESAGKALNTLGETLLKIRLIRVQFLLKSQWRSGFERYLSRGSSPGDVDERGEEGSMPPGLRDDTKIMRGLTYGKIREQRAKFEREKLSAQPLDLEAWRELQWIAGLFYSNKTSNVTYNIRPWVWVLGAMESLCRKYGEKWLLLSEVALVIFNLARTATKIDKTFPFSFDKTLEIKENERDDSTEETEPLDSDDEEDFWNVLSAISSLFRKILLENVFPGKDVEYFLPGATDVFHKLNLAGDVLLWLSDPEASAKSAQGSESGSNSITFQDFGGVNDEVAALIEESMKIGLFCWRKVASLDYDKLGYRFAFLCCCYGFLFARGRKDEARRLVKEERAAVAAEIQKEPFSDDAMILFADFVSDAALKSDDLTLAKELLQENVKVFKRLDINSLKYVPSSIVGREYLRLGFIAAQEEKDEEKKERLRDAIFAFAEPLKDGNFNFDCFIEAASRLGYFFEQDDPDDNKCARKIFRTFEKSFQQYCDANPDQLIPERFANDVRAQSLTAAAWIAFSYAAAYFDGERRCFYEANRLYRKTDELLARLIDIEDHVVPSEDFLKSMQIISFYDQYRITTERNRFRDLFLDRARLLLQRVSKEQRDIYEIDAYKRVYSDLLHMKGREDFVDGVQTPASVVAPLSEFMATLKATPEWNYFFVNKTSRQGLVDSLKSLLLRKSTVPDEALAVVTYHFTTELMLACGQYLANGGDFDEVQRNVAAILKRVRKIFGKRSFCEFQCLYYWGIFALRQNQLKAAIAASSAMRRKYSITDQRYMGQFDRDDSFFHYMAFLNMLAIEVNARLQLGTTRELSRAEAVLEQAKEMCVPLFSWGLFQFRPVFAEILLLEAKTKQRRNQYAEALPLAKRALAIMRSCEARGVRCWLPTLRQEAQPLILQLKNLIKMEKMNQG